MKTIACRILDQNQIPYTLHEYDWKEEELDALTVAHKVGIPPQQIFKTLVLRGDKSGVLLASLPGDKELDLKALEVASKNKRVEMVPIKDLQALTGYIRGGVSPLGVKKRYPFYLDVSAMELNPISISAGRRGLQIFVAGIDLQRVTGAIVASLTR